MAGRGASPEGAGAAAGRVRNPFERALVQRLHTPLCSPGMCKIFKKQRDGSFRWEIEQHCTLMPADIVACNSQFEPSPDPALDKIAEEATNKFFSQEVVMPSPLMQTSKKMKPLLTSDTIGSSVKILRDASAQTVLTLPPQLPPEMEAILESFCTFTQDQNTSSSEYEISANGSLRRKLLFEEHSDAENYDSEQTDDEIHHEEQTPQIVYETHAPIVFSPESQLSQVMVSKGMKRTFGTPLNQFPGKKTGYRNKILDGVELTEPCYSPIEFRGTPCTPIRMDRDTASSSTSQSISPVPKVMSSDDEKHNFTSPESEVMATCLNCVSRRNDQKRRSCYCKTPLGKSLLTRSASMKESPPRHRRSSSSLSEKRSLSMSSLNRSRSVQKLDFSLDMSVDGSLHEDLRCHSVLAGSDSSDSSPKDKKSRQPGLARAGSASQLYKTDINSDDYHTIDETPIKGKSKTNILTHGISQIRTGWNVPYAASPMQMSLDNSIESNTDNPLDLEDKEVDFNNVDLKQITSASQFDFTRNATKTVTSFKRTDSGFNENTTFYGSKSSYYESAIKPSELTVTDFTKSSCNGSKALKEISNVNWMRVDSGFKDETSSDNVQFYTIQEGVEKPTKFCFTEPPLRGEDKENIIIEDFDNFLVRASAREEAMSISDIFADEMAMNCNFSSTPSKNKSLFGDKPTSRHYQIR